MVLLRDTMYIYYLRTFNYVFLLTGVGRIRFAVVHHFRPVSFFPELSNENFGKLWEGLTNDIVGDTVQPIPVPFDVFPVRKILKRFQSELFQLPTIAIYCKTI